MAVDLGQHRILHHQVLKVSILSVRDDSRQVAAALRRFVAKVAGSTGTTSTQGAGSAMESSTQRFALEVLRAAGLERPEDFAGLGVIFYESLEKLPFLGLEVPLNPEVQLPVFGDASIARALAQVSSVRSGWHDGFHFVDAKCEALSHLAQFVSPPLPRLLVSSPVATGARHMTAALASQVKGILGCGILTAHGELSYFSDGICTVRERV